MFNFSFFVVLIILQFLFIFFPINFLLKKQLGRGTQALSYEMKNII